VFDCTERRVVRVFGIFFNPDSHSDANSDFAADADSYSDTHADTDSNSYTYTYADSHRVFGQ
jgi:hypothetical protein